MAKYDVTVDTRDMANKIDTVSNKVCGDGCHSCREGRYEQAVQKVEQGVLFVGHLPD